MYVSITRHGCKSDTVLEQQFGFIGSHCSDFIFRQFLTSVFSRSCILYAVCTRRTNDDDDHDDDYDVEGEEEEEEEEYGDGTVGERSQPQLPFSSSPSS